jgi:hypothetical protein
MSQFADIIFVEPNRVVRGGYELSKFLGCPLFGMKGSRSSREPRRSSNRK